MLEAVILLIVLLVGLIILLPFVFKRGKEKAEAEIWGFIFTNGFKHKVETFKSYNKFVKPNSIVFVGDSITQDYNVYEYFQGYQVYNRGIGGDTSKGLLTRMDESIFNLNPSIVILLIGTNDLAMLETSPEEIANRIIEAVDLIKKRLPQTKVVVQSVYPVNNHISPQTVNPRTNYDIISINNIIKSIPDTMYLDIHSHLINDKGVLNPDYTIEGLHINNQGYELITEIIKKEIFSNI